MIIDVRTIAEGHTELTQATQLESIKADLPPFDGDIACKAKIDRSGSTLHVHVAFTGNFKLECSRCLQPFDSPLSGEVRVIIQEDRSKSGEQADDDAVDFYYSVHDGVVDIAPAIFDEIMTALPLKPLCKESCKGITIGDPDISIDLDAEGAVKTPAEKQSGEKEIDPRWAALLKLKDKQSPKEE